MTVDPVYNDEKACFHATRLQLRQSNAVIGLVGIIEGQVNIIPRFDAIQNCTKLLVIDPKGFLTGRQLMTGDSDPMKVQNKIRRGQKVITQMAVPESRWWALQESNTAASTV
jgi:hypothetical protein